MTVGGLVSAVIWFAGIFSNVSRFACLNATAVWLKFSFNKVLLLMWLLRRARALTLMILSSSLSAVSEIGSDVDTQVDSGLGSSSIASMNDDGQTLVAASQRSSSINNSITALTSVSQRREGESLMQCAFWSSSTDWMTMRLGCENVDDG